MSKEKSDIEGLLNSLIEKGWKPRGIEVKKILNLGEGKIIFIASGKENFSKLRFLTVKESGLWQFCEENKMLIGFSPRTRTKNAHETYGSILGDIEYWGSDYEYRLIESSLKDESELEDFLLSNIVIKDEKK